MMTIVTHVTLRHGAEPEWDTAMRERLTAARAQAGFVAGQLLMPLDGMNKRVIVGTWQTRAAWEAWHADVAFEETRRRLEGLEAASSEHWWHEVIEDIEREGRVATAA